MEINFYYDSKTLLDNFKEEFNKTKNQKFKKEFNLKIKHLKADKFKLEIFNNNELIKTYYKYHFNNLIKFIEKNFNKKPSKINFSLYSDDNPKTTLKGTGFKNKEKAEETIKLIKNKEINYQKQVINTMINRAKYHPHQTEEMRQAIKVFEKYYFTLPKPSSS